MVEKHIYKRNERVRTSSKVLMSYVGVDDYLIARGTITRAVLVTVVGMRDLQVVKDGGDAVLLLLL